MTLTKEELKDKIANESNPVLVDAYQDELDKLIALENLDDDLTEDEVSTLINKLSSQLDKAVVIFAYVTFNVSVNRHNITDNHFTF